jgi:predicted NBD/HSP70 family sugar kinase
MSKHKITMTPYMTKVVNKKIVLDCLLANSPTSRAEVARRLQLSKPTVSLIVAELVAEGLVRETGVRQSGLGRPSVEIELDPMSRLAIGVELGVAVSRLIVTDILARPIDSPLSSAEMQIDTSTPERAAIGLAQAIGDAMAGLREGGLMARGARVIGAGVGVPAVVNSVSQEIVGSNPLEWSGPAPFGAVIRQHVDVPILVAQRVMAAAWAERWFGRGRTVHSLVYARIGSGAATGIILNDQLYMGASHLAGDIANMTFLPHGSPTDLHQPVALKSLVTREALVSRARQLLLEGAFTASSALDGAGGDPARITLGLLCRGAVDGDPLCRKVIVEAGRFVGVAMANVIGVLNPAVVVLGGPLADAGQAYLEAVREQVRLCCNRYAAGAVEIGLSELGDRAPALGMASLAIQQFLSPAALPDMRTPMAS